jgi:hypothetical protein
MTRTMKKIPIVLLVILAVRPSFACDLCGCSTGNYFIGPFPQFNKHFAGIQYSFQSFNTILNTDNSQFSKDFYQTMELLAGTKIKNKWQILAYVPYNIYHVQSDDGIKQNNGLGDITLIGNYNLFERKYLNRDTETVYQNLWIGAGIKVPTGKFLVDTGEIVSSANLQPGTGSVDFLLTSMYSYQIKSWGLNISVNYKLNQTADNFKFGNRLAATAFLFRNFPIAKITISPNTGLLYENTAANIKNGEKIADTGGNVLLAALGSELRYKNLVIGFNAEIPVISDLSAGQTDARLRGMCHLSFMF